MSIFRLKQYCNYEILLFFHHLFDFFDLKNNITTSSPFFCNALKQSATQSALVKLTVYQTSH